MVYNAAFKLIFEDEVYKISKEPFWSILQLTWKQHPGSEDYRRGYRQALALASEHNIKYWLTDSRQVLYLPRADQHWIYTQMCPLLEAGKLLKFATVMQPETFMTTDKIPISDISEQQLKIKKHLNLKLFLELSSAQAWLLEEVKEY